MSSAHYEQVADEISHGDIDRGLWLEAFAANRGDEQATRAGYIKLRIRKLRSLGFRGQRGVDSAPSDRHDRDAARGNTRPARRPGRGFFGYLAYAAANTLSDLWTASLWTLVFTFGALTAVGALCIGAVFYLGLYGQGALAWPFFTTGCTFLTFFLFSQGTQRLLSRPPTRVFYTVEILAVGAALWPVSHLMNPILLGRVPPSLTTELVFLLARFLHSGDPVANYLTAAVFFLPVYGILVYLRHLKMS